MKVTTSNVIRIAKKMLESSKRQNFRKGKGINEWNLKGQG